MLYDISVLFNVDPDTDIFNALSLDVCCSFRCHQLRLVVVHHKGADVVVKGRRRLKAALQLMLGPTDHKSDLFNPSFFNGLQRLFVGHLFFALT